MVFKENNQMRIAKQIYIFSFIILLVNGCQPRKHQNIDDRLIHMNLPNKGEEFCFASSFADTILFIIPETTEKSFLKEIDQIKISDSEVFISDKKKLLVFNRRTGKFLRQIGRQGKGPKEFNSIMNFVLKKENIYISTTGKNDILRYDINGNFLGKIKQDMRLSKFESMPKEGFASYDDINEKLSFYNSDFLKTSEIDLNTSSSKDFVYYSTGPDKYFISASDKLLLTTFRNDTIWNVTQENISPYIITNLDKKLLPDNLQVKYIGDFEKFHKIAKPYNFLVFYPTSTYIVFFQSCWGGVDLNSMPLFIYNPWTKKTSKYKSPFIFDDMVSGYGYFPHFSSGDYIISWVYATELKNYFKNGVYSINGKEVKAPGHLSTSESFKNQMDRIQYGDNQIIVLIKTKQNKPIASTGLRL